MKTLLQSLMLLLAGAGLARAQHDHMAGGPPGKLTVAVGSTTASANQEVEIPIILTGTTGMGALELVLTYDPAILEPKSAERGTLLSSNSLVEYFVNPSGRLAVTLISQEGVNGDGPVVTAHFLVKGEAGQKSALHLESVRAWNGNHLDFLVTTTAGEFTVGGGWPWWWIAIAVAAVLLFLLLLKFKRRTAAVARASAVPRELDSMKFHCPKCGQPIDRGSVFCNHCGQKLTST